MSLFFVLAGIALAAFAASRVDDEPLRETRTETEWTERHRVLAIFRAGPAVFKQESGTARNTRTAGLLLGGLFLALVGIAYLFV